MDKFKKVFICSPFHPIGNTIKELDKSLNDNLTLAKQACIYAIKQGYIPYAPHLYFPMFLSDIKPEERNIGTSMGIEWLTDCDEIWICGDRISKGMQDEINKAKELNIPIITYTTIIEFDD